MRNRSPIFLALLLFGATANTGRTQSSDITYGWYELGVGLIESTELVNFGNEPLSGNTVEFDPGFRFGIAFGGEFTDWLSVELQSGFHYNSIDSISGATSSSGNLYQVPILGNVIFKLPNKTRFVPYVGGGVGTYLEILDANNLTIGGTQLNGSDHAWTFGYQLLGGVSYYFNEDMSVGLSYHFGVADGPSWSAPGGGNVKFDAIANHSIAISLGFGF